MPSIAFQNREKLSFYPLTLYFFCPLPLTEIMCTSFRMFQDPEILTEQCLYSRLADSCKCLHLLGHCQGASEWVGYSRQEGLGKPHILFPVCPCPLSDSFLAWKHFTVMASQCGLRTLGQVRERLRYGGHEVSHPHLTDGRWSLRHAGTTVALKECA